MHLTKKKYKNKEVKELLDSYISEYEDRLGKQRDIIIELKNENKILSDELFEYKKNNERAIAVLQAAEEKAKEIEDKAKLKYEAEVLSLKNFSERWKGYFLYIIEKYPNYPMLKDAIEIKESISKIFDGNSVNDSISEINKKIDKANKNCKVFNPKAKIQDYIAATSDSGFNLDEVLNPGELELEDLCKELGLIDEE